MRIFGALYHVYEDESEHIIARHQSETAEEMGEWIERVTLEHDELKLRMVIKDFHGDVIADVYREPRNLTKN